MKRYIKAADSDYIKIGNRILPKNAMDMGYDSYETISRKAQQAYDAEKEEERKAAEKAEKEAAAKEYIDAFNRIYAEHKDDSNVDDLMEALFDEFVPMSGPTNSLAAEFIRAIERIRYRAYNDGDKFYTGYGLETAAPSAAFLADNLSEELARKIENIADHDAAWPDSQYLEALDSLAGDIVEYIADNLHLFGEGTTDSRDYDEGYYIDDWEERDHENEYEPDTSGEYLDILLDHDIISWEDVRDFLENLTEYYGGEVSQWARDAFNIINLSSEEYYEWDDHFPGEWGNFLDELMSEHENEINGYDEEEEEEYDEDEDIESATKISAAYTTYYADPNGIMGDPNELWTEESLKKYYDAEHNNDPVLEGYNSFEDWFYDTVANGLVEVDEPSETYTDSPTL